MNIVKAEKEMLFDETGKQYIDLTSGNGAVWLGHYNKNIIRAVQSQLDKVWLTGGLATPVHDELQKMILQFFPPSHSFAGLYSTGMEAAEFAIRIAKCVTKKTGLVGFAGSMHGKSMATAYLGWDNQDGIQLSNIRRLPFLPTIAEKELLFKLEEHLARGLTSAVFVEPLQGSAGCYMPSRDFNRAVIEMCRRYKVVSIYDEILTGFYRTGNLFCFSDTGLAPDIILIGKAIGNGFPVSAVVVDGRFPLEDKMLPGSTYANNPLAAAAVAATLKEIASLELDKKVANIEETIRDSLGNLSHKKIVLRGKGALWMLELPEQTDAGMLQRNLLNKGVHVRCSGRYLRILPPVIISQENLSNACKHISKELLGWI